MEVNQLISILLRESKNQGITDVRIDSSLPVPIEEIFSEIKNEKGFILLKSKNPRSVCLNISCDKNDKGRCLEGKLVDEEKKKNTS